MTSKCEDCSDYDAVTQRIVTDFVGAVENGDIGTSMKMKYFIEDLALFGKPALKARVENCARFSDFINKVDVLRNKWLKTIAVGDSIDVYSELEYNWFESKILETNLGAGTFKVHYLGWDKKYDEHIAIYMKRLSPVNTFTVAKRKPKASTSVATSVESDAATTATAAPAAALRDDATVVTAETTGRRRSRSGLATGTANTTATSTDINHDKIADGGEESKEMAAKEGKEVKEKEEKDLNDWICGICGWLEAADGSDLVLCEGEEK